MFIQKLTLLVVNVFLGGKVANGEQTRQHMVQRLKLPGRESQAAESSTNTSILVLGWTVNSVDRNTFSLHLLLVLVLTLLPFPVMSICILM